MLKKHNIHLIFPFSVTITTARRDQVFMSISRNPVLLTEDLSDFVVAIFSSKLAFHGRGCVCLEAVRFPPSWLYVQRGEKKTQKDLLVFHNKVYKNVK